MGDWTQDLQDLFGLTEEQFWEEQKPNFQEMRITFFDENFAGPNLVRADWYDDRLTWYDQQIANAHNKLDSDVEKAMEDEEEKAEQKQEEEDEKLDEDVEQAMAEQEKRQQQQEKEDAELDAAVEKAMAEQERKKQQEELEKSKQQQDDEQEDDYTGVVRRFAGGAEPIDPTDVLDTPNAMMFFGGDAPIDSWDTYDGLGGKVRFIGGIDPTAPEDKVGPKFRQPAALAGWDSLAGLAEGWEVFGGL